MEHQRDRARVVDQVAQLAGDVAEVDVDRDGPQLEGGEHRLDVGDVVAQDDPDVVPGPDPRVAQVVGQAVDPLGELGEGAPLRPAHQRGVLRHLRPHRLPEVGERVGRGSPCRHV